MNRLKGLSCYIFCIMVVVTVFAVHDLRLIDWQTINGVYWLNVSTRTSISLVKTTVIRSEILGHNGNALAVNKTVCVIVFDKLVVTKDVQDETILQLVSFLQRCGETWVDELPTQITVTGAYEYIASQRNEVDALKKNLLRRDIYVTAE